MPSHPENSSVFDAATLHVLACPACHGDLRREEAHLVCGACGLAYPIVNGIPVLIAERAESTAHPRS